MRSVIRTNPLARAAAACVVGGLAVLVAHQPVVALLHALGSTPVTSTAFEQHGLGHSGVPVVELLGRDLDNPDRLDIGPPAARMELLDRCSLSWCVAPDFDDLVRHLSAERSLAKRRRLGRRRQCTDRQRHLRSRIWIRLVLDVCCSASDAPVGRRPRTNSNLRGAKHTRSG
jgi:hypothetical protein